MSEQSADLEMLAHLKIAVQGKLHVISALNHGLFRGPLVFTFVFNPVLVVVFHCMNCDNIFCTHSL